MSRYTIDTDYAIYIRDKILEGFEGVPYFKWHFEDDQTLVAIPDEWTNLDKQTIYFSTDNVIEFRNVQINRSRLKLFDEYSKYISEGWE